MARGTVGTQSPTTMMLVEPADSGMPETNPDHGLMETEANQRRARGLGHKTRRATSRTYWQIVRENLFTFFNMTLFGIGVLLIGLGLTTDALVSSGVAIINAVMGIVQEVVAKRRLDRIALVTRARATVVRDGKQREIDPDALVLGDVLVLGPGDQVILDGRVVGQGRIEVDESLLTGESDPVPKQSGDAVFSGSYVLSGSARYQAEKVGDTTMASQLAAGARVYRRIVTPLQRQINLIVRLLLAIAGTFLVMLLVFSAIWDISVRETALAAAVMVGIVPAGLFLMVTVTYAMAAIRLANRDALIQQMNAVESLSHVNVFCMDKTGTLTANSLEVVEFRPLNGDGLAIQRALGAMVRSTSSRNPTSEAIAAAYDGPVVPLLDEIPFSSARKWSAVALEGNEPGVVALGAPELLGPHVAGGVEAIPADWTARGLRVLLVASSSTATMLHTGEGAPALPPDLAARAWVGLADELRPNCKETLAGFRDAGIDLKIISGDNPETVAALARQAGLTGELTLVTGPELAEADDERFAQLAEQGRIFGRISPEQKERLVDALRHRGHYVAMTGDGVNDVLALKKANLGIAMQSGSQATRAAADIVLLNDSFGALPDAFLEGQRVRMGLQGALGLFLTRAFVATLVILLVVLVQAGFPFSPTSLSLLTTLTVGIPATGLALWAHPATPPRGLLQTLVSFVIPAALTLAAAAFVVYTIYYFNNVTADFSTIPVGGVAGTSAESPADAIARDALTHLLILAGLVLVLFTAPPTPWFAVATATNHDWRPTLLALAMLPIYIAILAIRPLREFFGTELLSAGDYIVIGTVVVVWALVLRYSYRTRLFGRYFGYSPTP